MAEQSFSQNAMEELSHGERALIEAVSQSLGIQECATDPFYAVLLSHNRGLMRNTDMDSGN